MIQTRKKNKNFGTRNQLRAGSDPQNQNHFAPKNTKSMKCLQVSYKEDANKIVIQAKHKRQ